MAKGKNTSPAPAKSGQVEGGTTKTTRTAKAQVAVAPVVEQVSTNQPAGPASGPLVAAGVATAQIHAGEPVGSAAIDPEKPLGDAAASDNSGQISTDESLLPAPAGDGADGDGDGDDGDDGDGKELSSGEAHGRSESAVDGADPELDDAIEPESLIATLNNHTGSVFHVVPARVLLEAGGTAIIEFRDEAHKAKCERFVAQIRVLHGWGEGDGLFWASAE